MADAAPFLVVVGDSSESPTWVEEYETLEEAADRREDLLAIGPTREVFLAKRLVTRVVEVSDHDQTNAIGGKRLRTELVGWLGRQPIGSYHYRDIHEGLESEGITVAGVDPSATLLTALSRCEQVESIGARTGFYQLRSDT